MDMTAIKGHCVMRGFEAKALAGEAYSGVVLPRIWRYLYNQNH